jgi:hypothetical protein
LQFKSWVFKKMSPFPTIYAKFSRFYKNTLPIKML